MFQSLTICTLLAISLTSCQALEGPAKLSYKDHPCNRDCLASRGSRTCEYNFTVEHYQTLSRACYNCPRNTSDCFRPHCIPADGGLRAVKVVNRMMPGPGLNVCEGDIVVVNVYNEQHDSEGTTIHWHGMLQRGTPHMDGVPMITQCPIHSHSVFQYRFLAIDTGTNYWHAHAGMQRADGIFGSLVVRETTPTPAMTHYDLDLPEHTILIHDWLDQYTSSKFDLHHHGMLDNEATSVLINGHGSAFGQDATSSHDGHDMMNMGGGTTMAMGGGNHEMSEMDDMSEMADMTTKSQTTHKMMASQNEMVTDAMHGMGMSNKSSDLMYTPRAVFKVSRGKRYRFRFISNGILNCPLKVSIDNHSLALIASDGHDIEKIDVDSFTIFGGERYDVVVTADQPVGNYWIYVVGLGDCAHKKTFETAILRYEGAMHMSPMSKQSYSTGNQPSRNANPLHFTQEAVTVAEMTSQTDMKSQLTSQAVKKFYVQMDFNKVENFRYFDSEFYSLDTFGRMMSGGHGSHMYALQMNKITYGHPSSPLLTQSQDISDNVFCNETSGQMDCTSEFCECVHRIKVAIGDVVELVLISEAVNGMGNHPMHLHGYAFHVLGMEKLNNSVTRSKVEQLDNMGRLKRNLVNPVQKDTVMVPDGGYTIIRFLADNPGFWFFHCHVDFHLSLGLALVLQVGEPHEMPRAPADFPRCGSWRYSEASSQYSDTNDVTSLTSQSAIYIISTLIYAVCSSL